MSKQTSIEWLQEKLISIKLDIDKETNEQIARFIKEAIAMEKEQIKDAFNSGMVNSVDWFNDGITEESEQYYNETFKGGQDA
jgi:hypothetical protein